MFSTGPTSLVTKFGYLAVAGVVGLESVGLPLPGEATLKPPPYTLARRSS